MPDVPAIVSHAGDAARFIRDEAALRSAPWDPPVPLDDRPVPAFPVDVLSPGIREYVGALAEATQTPPDLAGLGALAIVALATARRFEVAVHRGYHEPVNCFVAVIMPPGTRKSSVLGALTRPVEAFEQAWLADASAAAEEGRTLKRIAEARAKKAEEAVARATDRVGRDTATQDAIAAARDAAAIAVPALPRLLVDDATPEALVRLLAEQGGVIGLVSAEGGLFDALAGRYQANAGAGPNLDAVLKAHCGEPIRVDRVKGTPLHVDRPALTIVLAVQPDVVQALAGKPGFRGRGLLGRFLWSWPSSLLGRRRADAPPPPPELGDRYSAIVDALLRLRPNVDPFRLVLSAEAATMRTRFEADLEPRLAEGADLSGITDWAGKLPGAVVRVAGLLHLADRALDGPAAVSEPVDAATMARAIRIGEYLIPHAAKVLGEMGADPTVEQARQVLAWLRRRGLPTFSRRDLFRQFCQLRVLRGDLEPLSLLLLKENGFIRNCPAPSRSGPGRYPSPTYEVHPDLLQAQNRQNCQNSGNPYPASFCDGMNGGIP